jgi:ADP-ribose pyrophosphatase YjhB (NUDIX family)
LNGPELRLREAARAVILDPDGRILLVRFEFADRAVWACPGGGLEPGESHEGALRRELREEVIPIFDGLWDGQVERFHLVETASFVPSPLLTVEQLRAESVTDVRWWTPEELAASREIHAPRRLPQLVVDLRERGAPPAPIDAGV